MMGYIFGKMLEKGGNGMWSSRDKDEYKRIAFSFDIVALIM